MEVPGSIYFHCPECGEYTLHHVIKAKFSTKKNTTLNGTAQCTECEYIHHIELREEKDITINLILSTGDSSEKTKITLPGDEVMEIDMEIMFGEELIRISRLEKNDRSLRHARVKELDTIWAKKFDSIPVRVSISHGPRTYSRKIFAAPDEEFAIGDLINFNEYRAVIKKIKDPWGMVRKGYVKARDVTRIYCAKIR